MDGFYIHASQVFVDLLQNTVSNEVCSFYFHVIPAVTDEIKALLRTIWSDSQIFSLVSLPVRVKKDERKDVKV